MDHLIEDEGAKQRVAQGQVHDVELLTDLSILVADTTTGRLPTAAVGVDAGVVDLDCQPTLGGGLGYFADTGDVLGGTRASAPGGSDPYSCCEQSPRKQQDLEIALVLGRGIALE